MNDSETVQLATVNPNKALWEKGDFTRLAETMRESGAALINKIGITTGINVLDLGCGDGTTAIPAAKAGANVQGVDIAENLVAAGNKRIKEERLTNISIREGDATNLQEIDDESFDLVVSIFGAMFAQKPFDVAKEMVRVTRRGGRIVMGNWIPNDPSLVAQILKISSAYTPPPPEGFISPMLWGVESHVTERFSKAGVEPQNISFVRDTFTFDAPFSPTAEKNGKASSLQRELEELFIHENRSGNANTTSIPATFLRVTVMR
jgi:ubiquinone/menaquinone biosynthesis C-methylase UbiE